MGTSAFSLLLITNIIASAEGLNRYPVLPDDDDTNSWTNAVSLNCDYSYDAILMHYFDEDYYTCSSSLLRSSVVKVTCMDSDAEAMIYVYKNSTSNLLASYNNKLILNYNNYANKLVSFGPNDVLYIKVQATTTCSPYTIEVDTSPNINDVKIHVYPENGHEPDTYYGSSNLTHINYYFDNSCNSTLTNSSNYTYKDAYLAAFNEWNKVGDVSLIECNIQSQADVVLYVNNSSYFDLGDLGITHSAIEKNERYLFGFLVETTYNFYATDIHISKECAEGSTDYAKYLRTIKTCIHELGHSLGLDHTSKQYNYMYSGITSLSPYPFNEIGDGDVMSYLYIYG